MVKRDFLMTSLPLWLIRLWWEYNHKRNMRKEKKKIREKSFQSVFFIFFFYTVLVCFYIHWKCVVVTDWPTVLQNPTYPMHMACSLSCLVSITPHQLTPSHRMRDCDNLLILPSFHAPSSWTQVPLEHLHENYLSRYSSNLIHVPQTWERNNMKLVSEMLQASEKERFG